MPVQFNNQQRSLPGRRPPNEPMSAQGKPRKVRTTQYFWLEMNVAFTSTSGENKIAATQPKNFPITIRGAWSDLVQPRVRFTKQSSGRPISTVQVPLLSLVGNTNLAHPMLYWRRALQLTARDSLEGQFVNDGAEAAGDVIFFGERPDGDKEIQVIESEEYRMVLDLGLSGGATGTGDAETQEIENDVLIYGALSTSSGADIQLIDTRLNQAWSSAKLSIGCFAGIRATGNVEPIIWYPTPYYLPRNNSIRVEWTNSGNETGKYIAFICERIIR